MTTDEIAAELDALISRYQTARQILVSLTPDLTRARSKRAGKTRARPISPSFRATTEEIRTEPVPITILKPKRPRVRRSTVRPRKFEITAFTAVIPQRPVAVSAAEASRHRQHSSPVAASVQAAHLHEIAAEPIHSLDALIRELRQRTAQPSTIAK